MERVVHKSRTPQAAAEWDVDQHVSMTPQDRLRVARTLKDRVYPPEQKDVREWHRSE